MAKLTEKQEAFCRAYIETGNASDAYRKSYQAAGMSEPCLNVKACELLKSGKISVRLQELREPILKKHNITVDSLLNELEEARQAALCAETVQSGAAVSATMAKAKLVGLDKQITETKDDLASALNKLIDKLPN